MSLDYSYQTSGDSDPAKTSSILKSHTVTIRTTVAAGENIAVLPSINMVETRQADSNWTVTQSYATGINILSFQKGLNINIQMGITLNGLSTSLKTGLRSAFKLTQSATISLQIESNNFRSKDSACNFNELMTRLTASQRF